MKAGKLTELVTIQARTAGTDALGQPNTTWTTFASVWAQLKAAKGIEVIKGSGEVSSYQVSVRIRWRTDILPTMRVVHDGAVYNINAVLPDVSGGRDYVDLVCEADRG